MKNPNPSWEIFKSLFPNAHEDIYEDNHGPDIIKWYVQPPTRNFPKPPHYRPLDFFKNMTDVFVLIFPAVAQMNQKARFVLLVVEEMGLQPKTVNEWKLAAASIVVDAKPEHYARAFMKLKGIEQR